jgi:hypothetical protein
MKFRTITLVFVIGSLFLFFASPHVLAAGPGKTVKLTVPNLPGGG